MNELLLILCTAAVNGLVTWGVVKTELRYLRRDVDHAHRRADELERRLRDVERTG
jgi:hypothetical protein